MFGWGPGMNAPSVSSDPEKERKPPANPTPLDFPVYRLPDVVPHPAESKLPDMFDLLADIKRPQDISLDRFAPLNLKIDHDVEIRDMFPQDHARSVPPTPWEKGPEIPAGADQTRPLMSNGLPYPPKERYETLADELMLDDDDVFREVARLPPREGRDRVRVTQTRKFWAQLERMSQYWDTSLDNYFERPATPDQGPPERESKEDQMAIDNETELTETKMDLDQTETSVTSKDGVVHTESSSSHLTVAKYTGRRLGAGHEMPDDVRDETIRSFLEMAAWPFGCQVFVPTLPPRLTVKSLLFPVRQSFQAARSPRDRQVARNGILEGPVLIAQCRPEIGFRNEGEEPGTGLGEVCDLFREVGGMLLAAQERAREGAVEQRPGEGKWWTTIPRFGGAPNDGILDDLLNGGIHGIPIPESMLSAAQSQPHASVPEAESAPKRHKFEHPFVTSLGRRPSAMRKLSSGEKWKIIQPGPSLWDKRMRYMQIGKARDSPFDDIYMVTSINHHIAILHLRVHRRYIDVLTWGESDFPEESDNPDQPWHVLKLQRSRWYDLLDAKDRVEGLKGVWSLFHYQQRPI